MINTSNEYKKVIRLSGKKQYAKASITLSDGTILQLDNTNIMKDGLTINDGTSASNNFQIGASVINQLTLHIANFNDEFSNYDFTNAIIRPSIGLQLSDRIETLNKGVFTVDDAKAIGSTIVLTALDNMYKLDIPYKDVTISYPITVFNLLNSICTHCQVPLATLNFTNKDFLITRPLDNEATTCREVLSWIAQLSGNFARCNINGALELKWYDIGAFEQSDNLDGGKFDKTVSLSYESGDNADGGNFTDYSTGDNADGGTFLQTERYHHIYALSQATIATDDIIITGIQVKAMGTKDDYGETVLFGTKGYVIEITDNPLITENTASIIANSVGVKMVSMRFRPLSILAVSDPSIEAGDVAIISDRKGNSYQVLITNLSYTIGNYESISCDAQTPSKKQSVRFSAETKAIIEARRQAKNQLTEYDLAVQQLNSVMANAMGYYPVREENEDGSYIDYMCDKPTLAESQIIWKKSIDGFAVSTNGGTTWTTGFTADGNIIAQTLSVIGINAEWIKVLSSFTVGNNFSVDALGKLIASNAEISGKVTADSGKIGPFTIDQYGLQSRLFEFMERDNYPLLWLTKPAKNGSLSPADGWSRANYEPDVTVLRNIDGNVETNINLMARNRPDINETGTIEINKNDGSKTIGKVLLSDNGLNISKDNNIDDFFIQLNKLGLIIHDEQNGSGFQIISVGSDLYIQSNGTGAIMFTSDGTFIISEVGTPVYLNGTDVVAEINSLRTRLNSAENDIFEIKLMLNMI